jgi:hypothetical protein
MLISQRLTSLITIGLLCLGTVGSAGAQVANADIDYDAALTEAIQPYVGPRIVINVAARQLKLYDEKDQLVKRYAIAVGTPWHKTPLGGRSMTQIVWNPWWIPPKDSAWAKGAKDTPPGPHNPLGPVKMKLGDAIMVHGTNKDNSVGHAASHGCMRMHNEEAKELARYIQEHVMGQSDQAVYDEYAAKKGRSFYVNLTQSVPIDVVYDVAEVQDGELRVYPDIYWRVKDKASVVADLLRSNGYDLDKIDMEFLKSTIKQAKGETEVTLPVEDLMLANREKALKTARNED